MFEEETASLDDCDAGGVVCFRDYYRRTSDPAGMNLIARECNREVAMIISAPRGRIVVFSDDAVPGVLDAQAVAIQEFMELHMELHSAR